MSNRVLKTLALVLAVALTPIAALDPIAAEEPVGALPTAEDFVTQQYEDFLSRPPDTAGLAYWSALIEDGLEPAALVEHLASSPEFEGRIAPLVRLYHAHFRRAPDYAGLTYWAGVARRGWSLAQISEQFVRSAEFDATYGSLTDTAYVDRVYVNVLGRRAEQAGHAYWLDQLQQGMTRGELMVAFSESPEYRRLIRGRVLATMLYVGMLRRAPEASGLAYWAGVVDDGTPYRNVIAGFLGAAEYENRIGRIYDEVHPLTGVPTRAAARRPALAVKIDNVDRARPQRNVEHADIVYEEMVEGRLTRLIAVFHSQLPDVVGPVRSVRTTDIDVLDQLRTPLLAASGANTGVLAAIETADLVNVNALEAGGAYYRDRRRRAPHNLYARTSSLYAAASGRGGQPTVLFEYRTPGRSPAGGVATSGVTIRFGLADIDYTWSPDRRRWLRQQNGTAHVTAAGTRLAPVNVVVLEVPYGVSSIDANSPEAHTVGSGPAHVFTAGERVTGIWRRSSSQDPIELVDADGDPIALDRGQTFVELAPPGSIDLN